MLKLISSSIKRRTSFIMFWTTALRSSTFGFRICCPLNASSCWVSVAARCPASLISASPWCNGLWSSISESSMSL